MHPRGVKLSGFPHRAKGWRIDSGKYEASQIPLPPLKDEIERVGTAHRLEEVVCGLS